MKFCGHSRTEAVPLTIARNLQTLRTHIHEKCGVLLPEATALVVIKGGREVRDLSQHDQLRASDTLTLAIRGGLPGGMADVDDHF